MANFRTRIEVPEVAGRHWRLRVLRDRQQYDDADGAAERAGVPAAGWSHFGQLWPSGLGLAQAMATEPCEGLRVLELGCGIGLPSLVLAARGADVTASDHHPLAARFLRSNALRNRIASPRFHDLAWRGADHALGRFGLVIAADVLYERDQVALLAAIIGRHGGLHGEALVADPGRGGTAGLSRALAVLGYALRDAADPCAAGIAPAKGIRLLRYVR